MTEIKLKTVSLAVLVCFMEKVTFQLELAEESLLTCWNRKSVFPEANKTEENIAFSISLPFVFFEQTMDNDLFSVQLAHF